MGGAASGRGGRPLVMSANDFNVNAHVEGCGSAATTTSRVSVSKPSISTRNVHTPSDTSGKENRPCSSVTVTSVVAPDEAVTVAPGMGTLSMVTVPECPGAANTWCAQTRSISAVQQNRRISSIGRTMLGRLFQLAFRRAVKAGRSGRC